jgi:hypothetical protein
LFAATENEISPTAAGLLAVKRLDQRSWQLNTATEAIRMLPFTEIGDEQYTTYFNVI